jgi:hypothetical protein
VAFSEISELWGSWDRDDALAGLSGDFGRVARAINYLARIIKRGSTATLHLSGNEWLTTGDD